MCRIHRWLDWIITFSSIKDSWHICERIEIGWYQQISRGFFVNYSQVAYAFRVRSTLGGW